MQYFCCTGQQNQSCLDLSVEFVCFDQFIKKNSFADPENGEKGDTTGAVEEGGGRAQETEGSAGGAVLAGAAGGGEREAGPDSVQWGCPLAHRVRAHGPGRVLQANWA